MSQINSKNIAKNTLLLYVRMLLTMLVSLYTVRVVLNTLGIVDYGIYSVVGGVVTMLSFFSGTMASACQRFFSFELGKNDFSQLQKIFGGSLTVFIIISIIIFMLLETVGLWFLNTRMVIPPDRLDATNWVYQFALFSFLLTIMVAPYNAAIIAHEDMSIYAYVSIIEVILKLIIVYLLVLFPIDKLKLYGVLSFGVTFIVSFTYISICFRKYKECRTWCLFDKKIISPIASYAGWNMIGAVASIFKINGTNILLNLFFGPIVNSARAIAVQVNSVFNNFVVNFYMAVRPQITKSYAAGDKEYFMKLIFQSAKASYFLLLVLSVPLLLETKFILELWLKNIPEYTVIFTRLLIINILLEVVNNQLFAALQASGRIKTYQLIICSLQIFILPISYLFLYYGASPESTLYISIVITLLCFVPQLLIANRVVDISIKHYLNQVVFVVAYTSIVAYVFPFIIYKFMDEGAIRFFGICFVGLFSCLMSIYYLGFTKQERKILIDFIQKKLFKKNV